MGVRHSGHACDSLDGSNLDASPQRTRLVRNRYVKWRAELYLAQAAGDAVRVPAIARMLQRSESSVQDEWQRQWTRRTSSDRRHATTSSGGNSTKVRRSVVDRAGRRRWRAYPGQAGQTSTHDEHNVPAERECGSRGAGGGCGAVDDHPAGRPTSDNFRCGDDRGLQPSDRGTCRTGGPGWRTH